MFAPNVSRHTTAQPAATAVTQKVTPPPHESKWPKLAKMAKQFLASPASSAGVERVFSAAGRMHSDMRKSMSNESLQHSLVASINTL